MYKNKVFRVILFWVWSCPPFEEGARGDLVGPNPKAVPVPLSSHLPATARSFLLV